jgi:hypothetical protein
MIDGEGRNACKFSSLILILFVVMATAFCSLQDLYCLAVNLAFADLVVRQKLDRVLRQ